VDHIDALENKSIYLIREAIYQFKNPALLWSIGKDSTTLLWLSRKAFFGKLPFPVMHIDTTFKFPEMYKFRDHWAKEWGLNMIVETNDQAIKEGVSYETHDAFTCCHELKTVALQKAIVKHGFDALFVGIRRDEHGIRAKERHFSSRDINFTWDYKNQSAEVWDHYKSEVEGGKHIRVHPLLEWTELDIWNYIRRENIPVNELYFSKNGQRYRSLGCVPITTSIKSSASTLDEIVEELKTTNTAERAGRAQDKEKAFIMQKLRSLGYM
jgi:sulfate adenylyltransferase subunit 2